MEPVAENLKRVQDRIGTVICEEDWVIVHYVYQFHPAIPDVGGKDATAAFAAAVA